MYCGGQDLVNPRDCDACPTASEVPQAGNTLKIPSNSHATPRGERESLEPKPGRIPTPRRGLKSLLNPTPTGHSSIVRFSDRKNGYVCHKNPTF